MVVAAGVVVTLAVDVVADVDVVLAAEVVVEVDVDLAAEVVAVEVCVDLAAEVVVEVDVDLAAEVVAVEVGVDLAAEVVVEVGVDLAAEVVAVEVPQLQQLPLLHSQVDENIQEVVESVVPCQQIYMQRLKSLLAQRSHDIADKICNSQKKKIIIKMSRFN